MSDALVTQGISSAAADLEPRHAAPATQCADGPAAPQNNAWNTRSAENDDTTQSSSISGVGAGLGQGRRHRRWRRGHGARHRCWWWRWCCRRSMGWGRAGTGVGGGVGMAWRHRRERGRNRRRRRRGARLRITRNVFVSCGTAGQLALPLYGCCAKYCVRRRATPHGTEQLTGDQSEKQSTACRSRRNRRPSKLVCKYGIHSVVQVQPEACGLQVKNGRGTRHTPMQVHY